MQNPRFGAIHLRWKVDRPSRIFKVRVVEPRDYSPKHHSELFAAVVTSLVMPQPTEVDPQGREVSTSLPDKFDLVTFPEAFVSADALIETVTSLLQFDWSGCLHVGLRPSEDDGATHLFTNDELNELVLRLSSLAGSIASDLSGFQEWLRRQRGGHFNIGCLFAVDVEGNLRLCLHPKLVRSRFEVSPLPERNMTEADLLVLVTLVPANRQLLSVTIQPLICSDLLGLETDNPGGAPMEAVTRFADCFTDGPPDHVDVVSVATCTPQPLSKLGDGSMSCEWHEQFRDAFRKAADGPDCLRHRFSIVVLSNFQKIADGKQGGLSGVFLPVPPRHPAFHPDVIVSTWGRSKKRRGNNGWSGPEDNAFACWENRGFVASLDPFVASAQASIRIFAFDVHRLPREHSLWQRADSLSKCEVVVGHRQDSSLIKFEMQGGSDAR